MPDDGRSWWATLPGLLTALAAVITALTGAYVAFTKTTDAQDKPPDPCKTLPFEQRPISCLDKEKQ